jgi:molybdopterin molybdotransferase
MAGFESVFRPLATATLATDAPHYPGRREYQRARIAWEEGRLTAHPLRGQGSHQLFGLVQSNGFVILPEESEGVKAGETVQVLLLDL